MSLFNLVALYTGKDSFKNMKKSTAICGFLPIAQPRIFQVRGGFLGQEHFDKNSSTTHEVKAPQEKISEFILLHTFETAL